MVLKIIDIINLYPYKDTVISAKFLIIFIFKCDDSVQIFSALLFYSYYFFDYFPIICFN